MADYLNDPSAVTRWLDTHRDQFYGELATRLDIDAGLEEVLLTERHQGLVQAIHGKLDVESGLSAILPPSPLPLPDAAEQPPSPGGLEWASAEIARMPLQTRLALRGSYAAKMGFAAHEVTTLLSQPNIDLNRLDAAATRIQILLDRQTRNRWRVATIEEIGDDDGLTEEQKRGLSHAFHDDARNRHIEATGAFDVLDDDGKVLYRASDLLGIGIDLDLAALTGVEIELGESFESFKADPTGLLCMRRWKNAVADYVMTAFESMYPEELAQSKDHDAAAVAERSFRQAVGLTESLTDLVGYLVCLEQMLNDFIGADLRNVDLAGVPLEGLRWSEQTTQWPEHWREQIREDSVHIEDDVYEIHYGTHTRDRNSLV